MPHPDTLAGFFAVSVLLAISPGPDNLFVLIQSAQKGPKAGLAVVIGLCLGLVAQTAAVAMGLAALFVASAGAFLALKIVGAAYLTWLAWGAFRSGGHTSVPTGCGQGPLSHGSRPIRMIGRGVVMNMTNPKVLVFFLAFLPQFVDPQRGPVALQITILGGVFIAATLLVFGGIACFSGAAGHALRRSARIQKWLNRAAAAVFLGLAVNLLILRR